MSVTIAEVFVNACSGHGMSRLVFSKLLKDSQLLDSAFNITDADIVFARVTAKSDSQRIITLQQFETALMNVAEKKQIDVGHVWRAVRDRHLMSSAADKYSRLRPSLERSLSPRSSTPRGASCSRVTQWTAEPLTPRSAGPMTDVRLGWRSAEVPQETSTRSRQTARSRSATPRGARFSAPESTGQAVVQCVSGDGPTTLGEDIEDTFYAFCGAHAEMDGASFTKLCKDSGIIDSAFTVIDADLLFARVVKKGQRRIKLHQLLDALALIADKKGDDTDNIAGMVAGTRGPTLRATKADAVRFYDNRAVRHMQSISAASDDHSRGHTPQRMRSAPQNMQHLDQPSQFTLTPRSSQMDGSITPPPVVMRMKSSPDTQHSTNTFDVGTSQASMPSSRRQLRNDPAQRRGYVCLDILSNSALSNVTLPLRPEVKLHGHVTPPHGYGTPLGETSPPTVPPPTLVTRSLTPPGSRLSVADDDSMPPPSGGTPSQHGPDTPSVASLQALAPHFTSSHPRDIQRPSPLQIRGDGERDSNRASRQSTPRGSVQVPPPSDTPSEQRFAVPAVVDDAQALSPRSGGCRWEKDPHVQHIFHIFSGPQQTMDGKSFAKFCKDCRLIDKTFTVRDADLMFARIVSKGQRRIGIEQFVLGLELVARKKGIELTTLQAALDATTGPTMTATKAEPTRFYDRRRPGASTDVESSEHHTFVQHPGFPPISADHGPSALEDDSQVVSPRSPEGGPAGEYDMEDTFAAFTGAQQTMDGKTFVKLCNDCNFFGKEFGAADADLIFAKVVTKGQRRITIDQFEEALQLVSSRLRYMSPNEVYDAVSKSAGPVLNATQTEQVRFYDRRSGGQHPRLLGGLRSHANVKGYDEYSQDSQTPRSTPISPVGAGQFLPDEQNGSTQSQFEDYDSLDLAFRAFCGPAADMDGKNFAKLCKDVRLLDKGFTAADADIVFAKVLPTGTRRINLGQFEEALLLVAHRKGLSGDDVLNAVAASSGPVLSGTRADAVRFHDKLTFSASRNLVFN